MSMSQSKLERLWRSYASQSRSTTLIRWLGYGLLLLALLDLVAVVVPYIINAWEFPNADELTKRVWEFKSIGEIVERLPVPQIPMQLLGVKLCLQWVLDLRVVLFWVVPTIPPVILIQVLIQMMVLVHTQQFGIKMPMVMVWGIQMYFKLLVRSQQVL